jgi:hypothetical protein
MALALIRPAALGLDTSDASTRSQLRQAGTQLVQPLHEAGCPCARLRLRLLRLGPLVVPVASGGESSIKMGQYFVKSLSHP